MLIENYACDLCKSPIQAVWKDSQLVYAGFGIEGIHGSFSKLVLTESTNKGFEQATLHICLRCDRKLRALYQQDQGGHAEKEAETEE